MLLLLNAEKKQTNLEYVRTLSEFTICLRIIQRPIAIAIDVVATDATSALRDQRVKSMVFDLLDSDGDGLISVEVRLPNWQCFEFS